MRDLVSVPLRRLLRFDERSLGLFRVLFGLTLIADLSHRHHWLRAFYANDGVLPNHNHLFLLGDEGRAFSLFHAFSSVGEAHFAFAVTLFIYLCFTAGWYTRAFHFASLICLVSLSARNVLFDHLGQSVAIGLLAITLFVPLGKRMSVDALKLAFTERREKSPDDLNDRDRLPAPRGHASLVPLVVLGFLALVLYGAALHQTGETWKDGSALYYALHVDRWTSRSGELIRGQTGLLGALTRAFRFAELLVVPIALVPVAQRYTRPLAIALLLFVGLVLGVLFNLGLYGWTLVAAAALLVPEELWEPGAEPRRPRAVYYDADCGICLWSARLLARLDGGRNITFYDNTSPPEGVSDEVTAQTMVVTDPDGNHYTDVGAVSQILRSVRFFQPVGLLLAVPGVSHLGRLAYNKIATNRIDISVALGLGACGIDRGHGEADLPSETPETPAARLGAIVGGLVSSLLALGFLLAFAAKAEKQGALPIALGLDRRDALVEIASWSRVTGHFDHWSPDPPKVNGALVVDAETRGGWKVDVLTGYPPDLELEHPAQARRGVLWEAYGRHIVDDSYDGYRKEFRRYLSRGAWAVDTTDPNNYIKDLTVYWVERPIPPPGEAASGETDKREIFNRTGTTRPPPRRPPASDPARKPPTLRPGTRAPFLKPAAPP